eukprot:TRINITY_DN748_c0_g1_i2.p1 TRINITY_DN748_c0_g1~~TRINITY_DN748_c0_g1_i2.p1  ORF type:complete len:104 (-),score=15.37 TRINITY_DN748_c0_g1_i2:83-352(-)
MASPCVSRSPTTNNSSAACSQETTKGNSRTNPTPSSPIQVPGVKPVYISLSQSPPVNTAARNLSFSPSNYLWYGNLTEGSQEQNPNSKR